MELLAGGIIVESYEESFKQILFYAYKMGTKSLNRKDIFSQSFKLNKSSFKIVDNTLGTLVNRRILVRPKHSHYASTPAHLDHLNSVESTEGKLIMSIDITSIDKVPDNIRNEKKFHP
tara:strand:+ start:164 stop:517 length:354 start_codon:yes stop_codon:yes gene_type:complete